jgi:multisubunit Na+/H+ antiporter MnhE subunit
MNGVEQSSIPLNDILRLVGALVSYGLSILLLILKKPPTPIPAHPLFSHTRNFCAAVIAIFLALTWGLLGNKESATTLFYIASAATIAGVACFFWLAYQVNEEGVSEKRPRTIHLFSYVCYSLLISWGLTAAAVFLTVLLLNPANPTSLGITKAQIFDFKIRVHGQTSIASSSDVPFRLSGGQVNFGCGETRQAQVVFDSPANSSFIGEPAARWENFSNVSPPQTAAAVVSGNRAVATGTIRGLDFQNFPFGIRNCPGGGHGELVLSGVYRTTDIRAEQRVVALASSISSIAASGTSPVEITLPKAEEMEIERVELEVVEIGSSPAAVESVVISESSPEARAFNGQVLIQFDATKRRILVSYRS